MEMNRRMLGPAEYHLILAPESNNGADDVMFGTDDDRFETNVVLILAALLCALIVALALKMIARFAIRCRRRVGAGQTCPAGLKKKTLRKIPVVVYGSDGVCPATEYPICLGEFEDGERIRVLPLCNHGFHVKCIDTWLVGHPSCPTCRHSLVDFPVVAPVSWESAGDRRV